MQNSQIVQLIFVQLYRSFLKLLTSDELMVDNVTIKCNIEEVKQWTQSKT